MAVVVPIDTRAVYAARTAQGGVGGADWEAASRDNAKDAPDAVEAQSAPMNLGGASTTKELRLDLYDFRLPSNGILSGIEVIIRRRAEEADRFRDKAIRLFDGAAVLGDTKKDLTLWPDALADFTHGGPGDLWGSPYPTLAEINNTGCAISAEDSAGSFSPQRVYCDAAQMIVYFTYNEIGNRKWFVESEIDVDFPQTTVIARALPLRRFRLRRLLLNVPPLAGGVVFTVRVQDDQAKEYFPAIQPHKGKPTDLVFDPPIILDENRDIRLVSAISASPASPLTGRAWFDDIATVIG